MKPEEKARELVDKFCSPLLEHDFNTTITAATQCAIICVEEILSPHQTHMIVDAKTILYWSEVLTILKS